MIHLDAVALLHGGQGLGLGAAPGLGTSRRV